jgi:hypothetical protein
MVRPNTAHEELQAVVGRALVDPSFCKGLLNGHRADCLGEFDLTNEQMGAARQIKATDLRAFASQLDDWITRQATLRSRGALMELPRLENRLAPALPTAA